ncbi:MAG: hypothetical protein QF486_04440 [Candidatus Woesearchaeota archaeon]|jgi:hypothetical protein|nr:hypothetical protein [Candidatus Woesearchaeota archaeon]MDP7198838.1 hypothetical protein [Candidatus Woesearchaeota archaeon]MDP7467162.1 hypothetical protein [Candidatus Woesearchaeota archaeon]MDP7647503.1 hypothetical protein [Candidatus Woesearchaeota archaeon]|tara:strand:- start:563 stop:1297 length:735 start_codon:yes stop_codon:yes gene_type:complete
MHNYKDKFEKYFPFTYEEKKSFWIAAVAMAVILASTVSFGNAAGAVWNLIVSLIITASALYAHHAGQRLWGFRSGVKVKQELWWYGLLIGLMLLILTRGSVKFFAMTGTVMISLKSHRLGFYRYHPMFSQLSMLLLAGPVFNVLLGGIAKTVEVLILPGNNFLQDIFLFNMLFAVYNMFPIPPLDGSKIFFESRLLYAFVAGTLLGYVVLAGFFDYYSYIVALLIGGVCWLSFYFAFEKEYRDS